MGDHLRAGKPSRYVTSHPSQLSLSSLRVGKLSTSLSGWGYNQLYSSNKFDSNIKIKNKTEKQYQTHAETNTHKHTQRKKGVGVCVHLCWMEGNTV